MSTPSAPFRSIREIGPSRYAPPSTGMAIDLRLDANEGPPCVSESELAGELRGRGIGRYPCAAGLERAIAERWCIEPERVLVTAGGDEAIDRACRVWLGPASELVLPVPTFEMIARYARIAGAEVVPVEWPGGAFPVEPVLARVGPATSMIAVVSPNNPTGARATVADLRRLAAAAPGVRLLVDCAYAEFADEDLTPAALAIPSAIVIRTFSKAFGLAGMRVGYALGSAADIAAMRSAGSPYPVCGVGLAAAEWALERERLVLPAVVSRVREERERLGVVLERLGARPQPSQGNFVLASFADAEWAWRALASLGIGVRRFAPGSGLEDALRITCPCDGRGLDRLEHAMAAALRPRALLLDMDGVIADVSGSYRRAIALTAESFGVRLTAQDIAAAKAEPDANNDWVVTQRLVSRRGVEASLAEVTRRFQRLYCGGDGDPGLAAAERVIPDRGVLERLSLKVSLAVVTGRPRADCLGFLRRFGLSEVFSAVVCMEDAPRKPDPAPVRLAMDLLNVDAAWMVGDTPDDMIAARAAGAIPIGIAAPGEEHGSPKESLRAAGATRVLKSLRDLEAMLP